MRGLFDGDKAFTRAVACELSRAFYGVVLELTSTQTGLKFTLAGEGIEVKLK
jgi:hypothetical protein